MIKLCNLHYAICGAKVMLFFDIYNIFFGNIVEKTIDSCFRLGMPSVACSGAVVQLTIDS